MTPTPPPPPLTRRILLLVFCSASASVFAIDTSGAASGCDVVISSDATKNGTVSSPSFPNPYAPRSHCRYDFQGRGKERVQIVFTDFNLYHPADDSKECESIDSVMAYVLIEGRMEKIDNFCGATLPRQLMSNGPRLMLEFRGVYSSRYARGFAANYAFTESEFRCDDGRAARHIAVRVRVQQHRWRGEQRHVRLAQLPGAVPARHRVPLLLPRGRRTARPTPLPLLRRRRRPTLRVVVGQRLRGVLQLHGPRPEVLAPLRPAEGLRDRVRPALLPGDVLVQRPARRHRLQRHLPVHRRPGRRGRWRGRGPAADDDRADDASQRRVVAGVDRRRSAPISAAAPLITAAAEYSTQLNSTPSTAAAAATSTL